MNFLSSKSLLGQSISLGLLLVLMSIGVIGLMASQSGAL